MHYRLYSKLQSILELILFFVLIVLWFDDIVQVVNVKIWFESLYIYIYIIWHFRLNCSSGHNEIKDDGEKAQKEEKQVPLFNFY